MFETAYSMLGNIPDAAIMAIVAGILRNIAGWFENAYKDNKIDEYEIKQLLGTIVKYFGSIMLLMLGLPIEQAVAGSFVLDAGTSANERYGMEEQ
jgi:hypothetical protein